MILAETIVLEELMCAADFDLPQCLGVHGSGLLFGLCLTAAAVREGRPSPVVWKPILKPLAKN